MLSQVLQSDPPVVVEDGGRTSLGRALEASARRYEPRHDVLLEGEPMTTALMLKEGWAFRYRGLEDGRRQILSFILPGELCDPAVLFNADAKFSVAPITSATFSELPRRVVASLARSSDRVWRALLSEMLAEAAIQREWNVCLGQRSASERLAHLFCELFHRLRATGLAGDRRCPMPVRQSDLASAIGVSEVHVNRTIRGLRADGLAMIEDRSLLIPDLAALESVALFDPSYLQLPHELVLSLAEGLAERRPAPVVPFGGRSDG